MNLRYLIMVFLLTASLFCLSKISRASEWRQIGYGTLSGVRFDVYIDDGSILRVGDQVRFWQGHVFYADQRLPGGESYIRVSIEREGDCSKNTAANIRAIFYAKNGSVVYNYSGDGVGNEPSLPDTIDRKALAFACAHSKSNTEGISR